jgi:hypothetical protein
LGGVIAFTNNGKKVLDYIIFSISSLEQICHFEIECRQEEMSTNHKAIYVKLNRAGEQEDKRKKREEPRGLAIITQK